MNTFHKAVARFLVKGGGGSIPQVTLQKNYKIQNNDMARHYTSWMQETGISDFLTKR